MKLESKWLLLAAAFGLPGILIGCRSRAELMTSTSVESPTRTVSAELEAGSDESETETLPNGEEGRVADAKPPAGQPETVSFEALADESPREILEAAGAVIEFDEQDRAVGIDLTEARISARVTRSIAELTDLQWADMRQTTISDADLAVICALPQFELLALGNTRVTDAGLQHLTNQEKLRFLSLDETAVTDTGLRAIADLPRLEAVSAAGTRVSRSAARGFEQSKSGRRVILADNAPEGPATKPAPRAEPPGSGEQAATADEAWYLDNAEDPQVFPQPTSTASMDMAPQATQDTGRTLNQVLQERLLDPEVLTALSQHLLAQQEYGRAARALQALATLQPQNQQVRFDLGVALARAGHFDAAHPHLVAVVGEATACYNLGVIAFEMNLPQQSERFFARAVKAAPDFTEARNWLAHVRQTTTISPATHTPQPVDQTNLVDLLMSEVGAAEAAPATTQSPSATGIIIAPAKRR